MLTDRFDEAFLFAHQLHRTQTRKGTPIPYISHLMTVAALVVEHGGNENRAIGALLHDAAEDQGGAETLEEIRRQFGDTVAEIVSDRTDAWTEPKPDWRARKEAYLAKLPGKPTQSLLVSLADKTHNAEAILFLTIASWVIRSGNGSTAARRARAGIATLWPTSSREQCPADCRTGSRGLWRSSRFECPIALPHICSQAEVTRP
jgi:hypothetical protein